MNSMVIAIFLIYYIWWTGNVAGLEVKPRSPKIQVKVGEIANFVWRYTLQNGQKVTEVKFGFNTSKIVAVHDGSSLAFNEVYPWFRENAEFKVNLTAQEVQMSFKVNTFKYDNIEFFCDILIPQLKTSEILLSIIYEPKVRFPKKLVEVVKQHESLTLLCDVDAKPLADISWFKDGSIVSSKNSTKKNNLALNKINRNNSGVYTCFASNIVGNVSSVVTVVVEYKPIINLELSSIRDVSYIGNANPVYLKCVADGIPKPEYKWNGPVLNNEVGENSTYILAFPTSLDFGDYLCEARNKHGFDRHNVKVIELRKPGQVEVKQFDIKARSVSFSITSLPDLGNGVLQAMTFSYRQPPNSKIIKVQLDWNETRFVIDEFTPFTLYEWNVTVENEIFEGSGQNVKIETLTAAPGPPTEPNLTALSSSKINVSWEKPMEANGIITNYSVKFFEKEKDTFETGLLKEMYLDTHVVFDGLEANTLYVAAVRAATTAGYGDWSILVEKQTDPKVPETPQNISIDIDNFHTITVSWPAPQFSDDVMSKYHLQLNCVSKEDGRESKQNNSITSAGRLVKINSMLPFADCEIQLREGVGEKPIWSNFSEQQFFTMPEGAPDVVPKFISVGHGYKHLHLRWNRPARVNGELRGFVIVYKNITDKYESDITDQLNNNTFYHTLTHLKPEARYEINVYARSGGGVSKASESVIVTMKKNTAVAVQETNSEEGSNTGALLGGVFAVLVVVVLVVVVLLYISRKKRLNMKHARSDSSGAGFIKLPVTESSAVILEIGKPAFDTEDGSKAAMFTPHRPIPITSLKDFISMNHANKDKGFIEEFKSIKPEGDFTYDISNKPENKCKNRYANILAYDHSRVVLNTVENLEGSDYVNANYIDGYNKKAKFIATQGPVVAAFTDFWRMVWEQNTHTIIMVTNLVERSRIKCQKYWPSECEKVQVQGNIHIKALDEMELADYVVRSFEVSQMRSDGSEQCSRKVTQYQFLSWPDHGVPQYATGLLQFVRRIRSLSHESVGPIVVHCSAGVGRTGTFITLDAMLDQIEAERVVDVLGFVTHVRSQRIFMVQTEGQYVFLYDALLESVACGNTEVTTNELLARIKHLSSINPGTTRTYMQEEFERLGMNIEDSSQYEAAMFPYNTPKNRFQQILPYESTRVKLWPYPNVEGSDYINASFINGYQQREAYILTQAPLENTIHDFWRMLWEYEIFSIVMISSPSERDMHHCYPYWPVNNEPALFGLLRVQIAAEEEKNGYIRREFKVTNSKNGVSRVLSHFMYFDWPKESAPAETSAVIEMIGQLQRTQQQTGNSAIVIHCSDGSGRSGALATLMYCLEKLKLEGYVDVFQTVRSMRTQRTSLVQHLDQYHFIYIAVRNFLDCFSSYANFK